MCQLSFSVPERGYTLLRRFAKIDIFTSVNRNFVFEKGNLSRTFVYSNDHKIT